MRYGIKTLMQSLGHSKCLVSVVLVLLVVMVVVVEVAQSSRHHQYVEIVILMPSPLER